MGHNSLPQILLPLALARRSFPPFPAQVPGRHQYEGVLHFEVKERLVRRTAACCPAGSWTDNDEHWPSPRHVSHAASEPLSLPRAI